MTCRLPSSRLRNALLLALCAGGAWSTASAQRYDLLTATNQIYRVDASGATTRAPIAITGLAAGETLLGMDYRPANGMLIGVGSGSNVYAINAFTGVATRIGNFGSAVTGTATGVDFNPTVDRIRFVTSAEQDLRLNPINGSLTATDGGLAYAAGDPNAGADPNAAGAAYTNSFPVGATTTLYVIDSATGNLVQQGRGAASPNSGQLFTIGSLTVAITDQVGFDIGSGNVAIAALQSAATGVAGLYAINLTTGAATLIGRLDAAAVGLAFAPRAFLTDYARTPSQQRTAIALESYAGVPNAELGQFLTEAGALDADAGNRVLQQMDPQQFQGTAYLANSLALQQSTLLEGVLSGARIGSTAGGKANGIWASGSFRRGEPGDGGSDAANGLDERDLGGGAGYLGYDRLLGASAILGVYAGAGADDIELGEREGDGKIESDQVTFGVYGSWFNASGWYVNGVAGFSRNDYSQRRVVDTGSTRTIYTSAPEGDQFFVTGTLGYDFAMADWTLGVFGGARYTDLSVDSFGENQAGGLAFNRVELEDATSLQSVLGARVFRTFPGATPITPEFRVSWLHEFEDDEREITATFNDPAIATFTVPTSAVPQDYALVGGGVNFGLGSAASAFVDYNVQIGEDDFVDHMVNVGVRFGF